ncbi:MAG: polyphosphate kinase 1, partial [Bacteroidota bacterium]
ADELNEEEEDFVRQYFYDNMLPYVQPVLLAKHKIRIFLNSGSLYLAVQLANKGESTRKVTKYALLQVPTDQMSRFIHLPSKGNKKELIFLEDIVRFCAADLFPGFNVVATYSIKFTRDAELDIDDEFSGDLIEKIKKSLGKRKVGPPTRFVYDKSMPKKFLQFLMEDFQLNKDDLLPEGRYHNNFDFFSFPHFGMQHLRNNPLPHLPIYELEGGSLLQKMREKDYLMHYPYHTYEYTIRFFEEAARDPDVTHIKIVQYRVASRSRIMKALMEAVEMGKQVTAFVEVKARFDEEANLKWAERLEKAGVNVLYSFPGLKVHAKLALVSRFEDGMLQNYTYLSTGNFHEGTAKIYSDFGMLTCDTRLTSEVARVFNYLETQNTPSSDFKHLLVGQFNLRPDLTSLIEYEIKEAKAGRKAYIILKTNSLEDRTIIPLLYKASQAGVQIKCIVRGICCLVPGVEGLSENIEVISIIDRFLEHARVYYFHHAGAEQIYLASADLMRRNLSYRIETAFPLYDPDIRKQVKDLLQIQLNDNVKARIIDGKNNDAYKRDGSDLPVRAQLESYYYFKRREEIALLEQKEAKKDESKIEEQT